MGETQKSGSIWCISTLTLWCIERLDDFVMMTANISEIKCFLQQHYPLSLIIIYVLEPKMVFIINVCNLREGVLFINTPIF